MYGNVWMYLSGDRRSLVFCQYCPHGWRSSLNWATPAWGFCFYSCKYKWILNYFLLWLMDKSAFTKGFYFVILWLSLDLVWVMLDKPVKRYVGLIGAALWLSISDRVTFFLFLWAQICNMKDIILFIAGYGVRLCWGAFWDLIFTFMISST